MTVSIIPPARAAAGTLTAQMVINGKSYSYSFQSIDYSHVPAMTLHPRAEARLVRVDLSPPKAKIGYIMGAGDDIPKYLQQVGFPVDTLSDDDLRLRPLASYQAIITGVRAYNTRAVLKQVNPRLLDYVNQGGRLIVQYNVSRGLYVQPIGPYPLQISQSRVTDEGAAVTILHPDHPIWRTPNPIIAADFDQWIQERGLYFADQWDPRYLPLMSCADKGEPPQEGGLLVAEHGKGAFIYTGLAFFRQVPAGVAGAMKLLVNMISYEPQPIKKK